MTSEYVITVSAATRRDALDIARRRARDDGYAYQGAIRVVNVSPGVYAVTLAVVRM